MGNRLVCCRLSWTSFSNSEDDLIPDPAYQSRFQFTNHGAFYPSVVTSVQPPIVPYDDNYHHMLSYRPKIIKSSALGASVQHISEREPEGTCHNISH